jgi:hypothetical protein
MIDVNIIKIEVNNGVNRGGDIRTTFTIVELVVVACVCHWRFFLGVRVVHLSQRFTLKNAREKARKCCTDVIPPPPPSHTTHTNT